MHILQTHKSKDVLRLAISYTIWSGELARADILGKKPSRNSNSALGLSAIMNLLTYCVLRFCNTSMRFFLALSPQL